MDKVKIFGKLRREKIEKIKKHILSKTGFFSMYDIRSELFKTEKETVNEKERSRRWVDAAKAELVATKQIQFIREEETKMSIPKKLFKVVR